MTSSQKNRMVRLFSVGLKHSKQVQRVESDLNSITVFTLRELKRATEGFCQTKVVGRGGFGEVFRGTLDDGTRVAIKRAKAQGAAKHQKQFLNEVKILSRASHPNVVKLIGCCFNNVEVLLVYEFIANGSLEYHLFRVQDPNRGCSIKLDWGMRLRIAIQTAQALNYLHVVASPPIFHRDVKPANILLDGMLNVKVADFGESKLVDLDASLTSTARPKGTLGYWDPDFFRTYQVTDKVDVYSFGVVLLVLVSSQKPIDQARPEGDWNLCVKSQRLFDAGKIGDIIDCNLTRSFSDEQFELVEAAARVAVACVAEHSGSRPSMSQVLEALQAIEEQFQLGFGVGGNRCGSHGNLNYRSLEPEAEDCSMQSEDFSNAGCEIRLNKAPPPCLKTKFKASFLRNSEQHRSLSLDPSQFPNQSPKLNSCGTIDRSPTLTSCGTMDRSLTISSCGTSDRSPTMGSCGTVDRSSPVGLCGTINETSGFRSCGSIERSPMHGSECGIDRSPLIGSCREYHIGKSEREDMQVLAEYTQHL